MFHLVAAFEKLVIYHGVAIANSGNQLLEEEPCLWIRINKCQ